MAKYFLTLDLEEWYHLDYLKDKVLEKNDIFTNSLEPFFKLLLRSNIKITVFVLGELALKYPKLVKSISDMGHEIACHGFDHDLLYEKSNVVFREEVLKAKKILEGITGNCVIGYRASCFSMDREKLEILKEVGYKYDSSLIRFSQHSLYSEIDMHDFKEVEHLVFKNNEFYEFEIPTLKLYNYNIPISGGGYFRILPFQLFSFLFRKYQSKNKNFVFYIHPFEVANPSFKLKGFSIKDKFRFSIGRKNNLNKFEKYIESIKTQYEFSSFKDYINIQ